MGGSASPRGSGGHAPPPGRAMEGDPRGPSRQAKQHGRNGKQGSSKAAEEDPAEKNGNDDGNVFGNPMDSFAIAHIPPHPTPPSNVFVC